MEEKSISELSRSLMQIGWFFGPKGVEDGWCSDLSLHELLALEEISRRRDCSVKDVKLTLNYTKSGATRIVNRLEKKGYVRKLRSEDDARICCISPTPEGTQVLREAEGRYSGQFQALLKNLDGDEAGEIRETMVRLARLINRKD